MKPSDFKLPNFKGFEPLNALKSRMGIPRDKFGDLTVVEVGITLTVDELEKLGKGGIDVTEGQYQILPDGTFSYKGQRVVLYIRDVSPFGNRSMAPRFHLANCKTLVEKKAEGRIDRYVVATREDGKYAVNIIHKNFVDEKTCELNVCQNCLDFLKFEGFNYGISKDGRKTIVSNFALARFYEKYPKSVQSVKVKYNSDNAPVNTYSDDWGSVSRSAKQSVLWICSECRIDLSRPEHQRFMDTHHKDGQKYNNDKSNLEPICIGCHANEPQHSHMKNTPRYFEFIRIKHLLRYALGPF